MTTLSRLGNTFLKIIFLVPALTLKINTLDMAKDALGGVHALRKQTIDARTPKDPHCTAFAHGAHITTTNHNILVTANRAPCRRTNNADNKKPATARTVRVFGITGGDEKIRTSDTLLGYAPLAGECLRPLGHVSKPDAMILA